MDKLEPSQLFVDGNLAGGLNLWERVDSILRGAEKSVSGTMLLNKMDYYRGRYELATIVHRWFMLYNKVRTLCSDIITFFNEGGECDQEQLSDAFAGARDVCVCGEVLKLVCDDLIFKSQANQPNRPGNRWYA